MPKPSSRSRPPPVKAGFRRVGRAARSDPFEGWQPGLVLVAFAAVIAAVVVPRAVEPGAELPEPAVDRRALLRSMQVDDALAAEAEGVRLDVDVRALGSAYRAYGRADRLARPEYLSDARQRVAAAAGRALRVGEAELAKLRAFEELALLREVRHWVSTGDETDELMELGGGLLNMLHRNGWVVEPPAALQRRILIDEASLRVVFKKRWAQVTGLEGGPLAVSIDEERVLYRFLLRHPPSQVAAAQESGGAPDDKPSEPEAGLGPTELRRRALVEGYRSKKVDELSRVDPAYPSALAKGMLAYRTGRYLVAVELFRRHLERTPDGPYALRATNYLRAALERAGDE